MCETSDRMYLRIFQRVSMNLRENLAFCGNIPACCGKIQYEYCGCVLSNVIFYLAFESAEPFNKYGKLVSSVPFLPTSDVCGILVCFAAGGHGRERVGVGCPKSRPLQPMLPAALSLSLV